MVEHFTCEFSLPLHFTFHYVASKKYDNIMLIVGNRRYSHNNGLDPHPHLDPHRKYFLLSTVLTMPAAAASAPHSAQVDWVENSTFRQAISEQLFGQRFVDVTLSCEGKLLRCHRLILATSSAYFENLLGSFPTQQPIIIMHNVKSWQMQAIIKYIYMGEIQVDETQLDELLAVAETLSIRGLCDLKRSKEMQEAKAAETQFTDFEMGEAACGESQQEPVEDADETQSIIDVDALPEEEELTDLEVKQEIIDALAWPEPYEFTEIPVTDIDMKQENIEAAFEEQQPEETEECPIQREKRAILRRVKEAIMKKKNWAPKVCSLDSLCTALVELQGNPDIVW
jgi:BTB/POZ domain